MSKPVTNIDFAKITLRLPRQLLEEIQDVALHQGISTNSEILQRLTQSPIVDRLDRLADTSMDVRNILKEILEAVRPIR